MKHDNQKYESPEMRLAFVRTEAGFCTSSTTMNPASVDAYSFETDENW